MESDNTARNMQIVANANQTAMIQVPWNKQTITYDATPNPITLKYYKEDGVTQCGEVHITYNGAGDPVTVEKVSF